MSLPYDVVEDVVPHNSMLQHIVLADVYWQVADGIAIILYLADVIAKWQMPLRHNICPKWFYENKCQNIWQNIFPYTFWCFKII